MTWADELREAAAAARSLRHFEDERVFAESAASLDRMAVNIRRLLAELERCCPPDEGYCCCGDPIETHGSGHSPVDAGAYHRWGLVSETTEALHAAGYLEGETR